MLVQLGKAVWLIGFLGWFVIRYPYARRAKRIAKTKVVQHKRELVLMAISACGLGAVPLVFTFTDRLQFADYPPNPWAFFLGAALFAISLWLFHETHKQLGRNWSVTLEVRDQHTLVTTGPYKFLRHPMYSAFWLWAIAQALLLPNWIAGFAGVIGFGTLFFLRVRQEEKLMLETFGECYRNYMERTWRVLPGIF